jgi:hypothetical protein
VLVEELEVPKYVETFPTQIHGWMAARSDLENPEVRKEYERGLGTQDRLSFSHSKLVLILPSNLRGKTSSVNCTLLPRALVNRTKKGAIDAGCLTAEVRR